MKIIFPEGLIGKVGSANVSFFGNFIYDQILRCRPHFLQDLSGALDFAFIKEVLKNPQMLGRFAQTAKSGLLRGMRLSL